MIVQANCLSPLPLADASVDMCVTSPPYFSLRDYGVPGQIGLEATPEEFIANMVAVFREVRRVLKPEASCWVNMGDSYASAWSCNRRSTIGAGAPSLDERANRLSGDLKEKDLIGIPWMLAFALRADGWYLRSDIIWSKPNPMPESVTDRPTKAHEYLFLLSKSARYYYDAEAIKEPQSEGTLERFGNGNAPRKIGVKQSTIPGASKHLANGDYGTPQGVLENGRNRRSVWTVATEPFSGAHFATFPTALVEPCILAGTSARGNCPVCGAAWVRVTERYDTGKIQKMTDGWDTGEGGHGTIHRNGREKGQAGVPVMASMTTGWRSTCAHDAEPVPAIVLDPFAGSGTTGAVARLHGRRFVGLDLSMTYLRDLALARAEGKTAQHLMAALPLFAPAAGR